MHVGLLTLNGEKMSKSIGNLILAKDFVKDYGSNVLKYLYLQNNYTKPINITDDLIKSCVKFDNNVIELVNYLQIYKTDVEYNKTQYLNEFDKLIENLSMPNIYSLLQKIIKDFNKNLIDQSQYFNVLNDLQIMFRVLDLTYPTKVNNHDIEIINNLNNTKDFEKIEIILEQNPNYKKTRKG